MSTDRKTEAVKNAVCAFLTIVGMAALVALGSGIASAHGQAVRFPMAQFGLVLGIGAAAALVISAYIYLVERN